MDCGHLAGLALWGTVEQSRLERISGGHASGLSRSNVCLYLALF